MGPADPARGRVHRLCLIGREILGANRAAEHRDEKAGPGWRGRVDPLQHFIALLEHIRSRYLNTVWLVLGLVHNPQVVLESEYLVMLLSFS